MYKKSQGLSINIIIIAVIALIILVVLVAVFTGRIGSFVSGVDETASCESSCVALGMTKVTDASAHADRTACTTANEDNRWLGGGYRDNAETDKGCCCS